MAGLGNSKTGGREAGTPNKRTLELCDRLGELNCDPITALVEIASSENVSTELRVSIYQSLLPYLYPKRKSVEVRPDESPQIISLAYELRSNRNSGCGS
jgi:hypothetical protein